MNNIGKSLLTRFVLAIFIWGLGVVNVFAMDSHKTKDVVVSVPDFGALSVLPDELIVKILACYIEANYLQCADRETLHLKIEQAIARLVVLRSINRKFQSFLISGTILSILRFAQIADYANQISVENGEALLHRTIRTKKFALAEVLINTGANVNSSLLYSISPRFTAAYPIGSTPLHTATRIGNVELVTLLLQRGADVTALTTSSNPRFNNVTALDFARRSDRHEIIAILEAEYQRRGLPIPPVPVIAPNPAARQLEF